MVEIDYVAMANYLSAKLVLDFFLAVLIIVIFIIVIKWIINVEKERKSKGYRKLLMDLYVAGKVRKIAKSEDISLIEEGKMFESIVKKSETKFQDLDNTLEDEMKEKIVEDFDKAKDKKYKKDKTEEK